MFFGQSSNKDTAGVITVSTVNMNFKIKKI